MRVLVKKKYAFRVKKRKQGKTKEIPEMTIQNRQFLNNIRGIGYNRLNEQAGSMLPQGAMAKLLGGGNKGKSSRRKKRGGQYNFGDFMTALRANWGQEIGGGMADGDANSDEIVDVQDILYILNHWEDLFGEPAPDLQTQGSSGTSQISKGDFTNQQTNGLGGMPLPAGAGRQTNQSDVQAVVNHWGSDGSDGGDLNGDGVVDINDLLAALARWGLPTPTIGGNANSGPGQGVVPYSGAKGTPQAKANWRPWGGGGQG
jgi:hypothetical protein